MITHYSLIEPRWGSEINHHCQPPVAPVVIHIQPLHGWNLSTLPSIFDSNQMPLYPLSFLRASEGGTNRI